MWRRRNIIVPCPACGDSPDHHHTTLLGLRSGRNDRLVHSNGLWNVAAVVSMATQHGWKPDVGERTWRRHLEQLYHCRIDPDIQWLSLPSAGIEQRRVDNERCGHSDCNASGLNGATNQCDDDG